MLESIAEVKGTRKLVIGEVDGEEGELRADRMGASSAMLTLLGSTSIKMQKGCGGAEGGRAVSSRSVLVVDPVRLWIEESI